MGVQLNFTSVPPALPKIGIMLEGSIRMGGPTSCSLAMVLESLLKETLSYSDRLTTSPLRCTSPEPFFRTISLLSARGSLRTSAEDSGARFAFAPATITWDCDPWEYVAVAKST